jgi:hypothetical protein
VGAATDVACGAGVGPVVAAAPGALVGVGAAPHAARTVAPATDRGTSRKKSRRVSRALIVASSFTGLLEPGRVTAPTSRVCTDQGVDSSYNVRFTVAAR